VSNVPRRGSHILTHSPHSLPLRNCLYGVSIATICLFKVAIPSNSGVQMQSPPAHVCISNLEITPTASQTRPHYSPVYPPSPVLCICICIFPQTPTTPQTQIPHPPGWRGLLLHPLPVLLFHGNINNKVLLSIQLPRHNLPIR